MKAVLAIDGGGMRGIIPISVLAKLEALTGRPAYRTFDLIAGTSTGGIIAAALAVMVAPESLLHWYKLFGPKIFSRSLGRKLITGFGLLEEKYDSKTLEDYLVQFFSPALNLRDSTTKLMVSAYDLRERTPVFFKSWRNEHSLTPLWQVCRATTAAPSYFEPCDIAGHSYIDGGVVVNNPALCAYAEARALWPDEEILVLSLGTGCATAAIDPAKARSWGAVGWIRPLIDVFMQGSIATVDYQMRQLPGCQYYRIDAPLGYEALDDARESTISRLEGEAAPLCLKLYDVVKILQESAKTRGA